MDQVVWDVGEEEDVGEVEDRSFSEGDMDIDLWTGFECGGGLRWGLDVI